MSKWVDCGYSKMMTAVRHGILKRPRDATCQECGKVNAHKHHDDYSRPLDVMYLCPSCHMKRHNQILKWGKSGRTKGRWMFNFSVLPVGGFVHVKKPVTVMSVYVNKYRHSMMPNAAFKTFTFRGGTIIFRTK